MYTWISKSVNALVKSKGLWRYHGHHLRQECLKYTTNVHELDEMLFGKEVPSDKHVERCQSCGLLVNPSLYSFYQRERKDFQVDRLCSFYYIFHWLEPTICSIPCAYALRALGSVSMMRVEGKQVFFILLGNDRMPMEVKTTGRKRSKTI